MSNFEEMSNFEAEKITLEEMLQEKTNEIETLKKNQVELEEIKKKLTKNMEDLKNIESNLKQEIELLNQSNKSSEEEVTKLNDKILEANESSEEFAQRLATMEKKLQETKEKSDKYQTELMKQKENANKLSDAEMAQKDEIIKNLKAEAESFSKTIERYVRIIKTHKDFIKSLKQDKFTFEFRCQLCRRSPLKTSYILNCGHLAFCNDCSLRLIQKGGKCPICNILIQKRLQAFVNGSMARLIQKEVAIDLD